MNYSIVGVKKLKTMSIVERSQAHSYRTVPTKNADPSRTNRNRTLVGTKGDVVGDVKRRIGEITDNPRKNAVPALEFLLSASPEWWQGKTPKDLKAWVTESLDWAKQRYGEKNVVHAVLHLDETSPHIAMYVVPEIEGRLSARDVYGNKGTMRQVHTSYAEAMKPFGLKRGIQGSQAKHQTVRQFYDKLDRTAALAAAEAKKLGELSSPPAPRLLQGQKARQEALEGWKVEEQGKRKRLVSAAARAHLTANQARQEVQQLKEENSDLSARVERLEMDRGQAYEELGLNKEQIQALRKSDISLVAHRLGFMGEVRPKENAIDLVKRVNGFDYGQAVAWLHHEIGSLATGMIVTKALDKDPPVRPFTPAENVIKQTMTRQLDALGCDKYRLSIVPEKEGAKPYLPGKLSNSEERFYSRDDLMQMIPWLRFENNQGKHVFITPMDDHAYYILLDDAKVSQSDLEKQGFEPCLIQKTSWEKQQTVFKVPKSLDREAVLKLFNDLNKSMGDEQMTGLRHPFRLAGFRNMKAKHERDGRRPFVEITCAVNRFCRKCIKLIEQAPQFQLQRREQNQPSRPGW